jgi:plastocyanin
LLIAVVASSSTRDLATAPPRVKHPVVTVHAREYAFVAPARIAAGTTTFRLVNDGKEAHQVSILKLAPGKTPADFLAAAKANQPMPWAIGAGGPNAAEPGRTIEATVTLEPGSYVLVCWVPSRGPPVPHLAKGMIHPLTVIAAEAPATAAAYAPDAAPDVRVELADYTFKFSKPLTAGTHTIQVVNTGPQEHEAVFEKLAPGKTMHDVDAWFERGMQGPAPMTGYPGMAALGKGRTGTFTTTLTPGRYVVVCYVPDAKDGKPHEMHGMVQELTVAAK